MTKLSDNGDSRLPDHMFTRMPEHARRTPAQFADLAPDLFRAMVFGARIGFETVDWLNGGLFNADSAYPWNDPTSTPCWPPGSSTGRRSICRSFGTLFERGLDPDKRAQLGAHYTDRDKIMLLVEPVVIGPEVRHCRNEENVQESGIYWLTEAKGKLLGYLSHADYDSAGRANDGPIFKNL